MRKINNRINTDNAVTAAPHEINPLQSKTEYYKHINISQGSTNV